MEIEHGVFTPLIFGSTGGQGKECDLFLKRLAYLLSEKMTSDYSKTISAIRCKLSFLLVRSSVTCLRGSRIFYKTTGTVFDPDFTTSLAEF